jgi:hypothetical protein
LWSPSLYLILLGWKERRRGRDEQLAGLPMQFL